MAFQFKQGDRPLPGYTIQRGVGRGGFGEVYYATSDGGKEVALKYLRENPQIELRGVGHCLNLKSPYLVDLHDVRQNSEGDSFVIMEYVSGPSLRELMNAEPTGLGPQKAAYFLRELGKGLSYLHDRGIVHRDMKPGNVFYEDGYVKIGDYGLAKIMAASQHSGQTASVGTVHYMAPEVGSGNYDRTIDIYALGVILYEMLLGRVPFSGATMGEVLMKHLTAQPEVDELPEPFPRVIRKALAKDPNDRYQTVAEMLAEVFAVGDVSRSVASLDSLSLTRMAAAVSEKVKAAATVGVGPGGGAGSSNVPPLGGATPGGPPPIIERGRVPAAGRMDAARGAAAPLPAGRLPLRDDQGRVLRGFVKDGWFPEKSRLVAGLLGIFLGPFGAHRFYTGFTRIGVGQIVLSILTGGIAGLWGIIEGIRILAGFDYRDVLGRPLLESTSRSGHDSLGKIANKFGGMVSDFRQGLAGASPEAQFDGQPARRSGLAKTLWGVLGAVMLLTACGLTIGGTLTPPDYDAIWGGAEMYWFNAFDGMFIGAAAAFCLGAFAVWKATHRAGMGSWRSTLRPALMCFCAALVGTGLTYEWFIAPAGQQLAVLAFVGIAAIGFVFLWHLRGTRVQFRRHDVHWIRTWMKLFFLLAVLSAGGATMAGVRWADRGFPFASKGEAYQEIQTPRYFTSSYLAAQEVVTRRVRVPVYDHSPVFGGLLALLAIGAVGEALYRRQGVARALNALPDDG